MTEINVSTFIGLNELKELYLYYNRITSIHPDSLSFMTALETVHLGGNKIEILPKGLLKENTNLKRLVLFENRIKSIDINVFKFLTKLEDVSFADNHCIDNNFNIFSQDNFIEFQRSIVPCYSNSQRKQIEMLEDLPGTLEIEFNLLNTSWLSLNKYSTELYGNTQQTLNSLIQDINKLSNKAKSITNASEIMLEKMKVLTDSSQQETVDRISQKKTDLSKKFMIVLIFQIIIFICLLLLMSLLVFGLWKIKQSTTSKQ